VTLRDAYRGAQLQLLREGNRGSYISVQSKLKFEMPLTKKRSKKIGKKNAGNTEED